MHAQLKEMKNFLFLALALALALRLRCGSSHVCSWAFMVVNALFTSTHQISSRFIDKKGSKSDYILRTAINNVTGRHLFLPH